MERFNLSKLAILVLALALTAMTGCTNRGGDSSGNTEDVGMDGDASGAGFGANTDGTDGYGYGAGQNGDGSGAGFGGDGAISSNNIFYFEYDSSELRSDAMSSLDAHASSLKSNGARVVLEGHTDERGTREYNMALGERRAKAVQRYLVMQGVPVTQLEVVSWGEERPAEFGSDEYSWSQNRRVELRNQ